MKTLNILFFLLLIFTTSLVKAQEKTEESCSFESSRDQFYKQNPKAKKEAVKFERIIAKKSLLRKKRSKKTNVYYTGSFSCIWKQMA